MDYDNIDVKRFTDEELQKLHDLSMQMENLIHHSYHTKWCIIWEKSQLFRAVVRTCLDACEELEERRERQKFD